MAALIYSWQKLPWTAEPWQGHSPWGNHRKEADMTLANKHPLTLESSTLTGHFLTCSLILAQSGAQSSSSDDTLSTLSPWTFSPSAGRRGAAGPRLVSGESGEAVGIRCSTPLGHQQPPEEVLVPPQALQRGGLPFSSCPPTTTTRLRYRGCVAS